MLHYVKFKKDYRCFKKEEEFFFHKGVNLLVGDQGTGKSTLLDIIFHYKKNDILFIKADNTESTFFDFEKDMPRNQKCFSSKIDIKASLGMQMCSHGQAVNHILRSVSKDEKLVIFLDEPDMALSVRSCNELILQFEELVNSSFCQIIASVHNPILIMSQENVLSVEHHKWMNSVEFLETQGFKL